MEKIFNYELLEQPYHSFNNNCILFAHFVVRDVLKMDKSDNDGVQMLKTQVENAERF